MQTNCFQHVCHDTLKVAVEFPVVNQNLITTVRTHVNVIRLTATLKPVVRVTFPVCLQYKYYLKKRIFGLFGFLFPFLCFWKGTYIFSKILRDFLFELDNYVLFHTYLVFKISLYSILEGLRTLYPVSRSSPSSNH